MAAFILVQHISLSLGRMQVNFYNSKAKLVAQTLSEADGFFSFAGLPADTYIIKIDAAQLKKLNIESLTDPPPCYYSGWHALFEGFAFVSTMFSRSFAPYISTGNIVQRETG